MLIIKYNEHGKIEMNVKIKLQINKVFRVIAKLD